nr:MAG TPA: hypothetical protein [Caudoviricetes sp.]
MVDWYSTRSPAVTTPHIILSFSKNDKISIIYNLCR